jgi:hypothetical protein
MPAKHNHTSFAGRLGDHYMPFTKVSLGHSCILLRFPHLRPLLHQVNPRYSHTLPRCSWTRQIPKVPELVRKSFHTRHVVAHVVLGSAPKNQSLADSSKNHTQTMKVATFPNVSWPCSNLGIYQLWVHSHRIGSKTTNHHSSTLQQEGWLNIKLWLWG